MRLFPGFFELQNTVIKRLWLNSYLTKFISKKRYLVDKLKTGYLLIYSFYKLLQKTVFKPTMLFECEKSWEEGVGKFEQSPLSYRKSNNGQNMIKFTFSDQFFTVSMSPLLLNIWVIITTNNGNSIINKFIGFNRFE